MTHQQVNGAKKPYIQFFCVAEAKFLVNSTSQQRIKHYIQVFVLLKLNFYSIQQVNSLITLPHLPRLIDTRHNRICHINKSTEKKTYMQFLFELLKINVCRIQQVNSEITPPLHPRFINKRQNMPYQQVNGEKKTYIQFFLSC